MIMLTLLVTSGTYQLILISLGATINCVWNHICVALVSKVCQMPSITPEYVCSIAVVDPSEWSGGWHINLWICRHLIDTSRLSITQRSILSSCRLNKMGFGQQQNNMWVSETQRAKCALGTLGALDVCKHLCGTVHTTMCKVRTSCAAQCQLYFSWWTFMLD